jgi:predicted RNA-binding protein YlqC (UPF0109 family)
MTDFDTKLDIAALEKANGVEIKLLSPGHFHGVEGFHVIAKQGKKYKAISILVQDFTPDRADRAILNCVEGLTSNN